MGRVPAFIGIGIGKHTAREGKLQRSVRGWPCFRIDFPEALLTRRFDEGWKRRRPQGGKYPVQPGNGAGRTGTGAKNSLERWHELDMLDARPNPDRRINPRHTISNPGVPAAW